MTRHVTLALAAFTLASTVGCQEADDPADEFRQGVPRRETVSVVVPNAGRAHTEVGQALRGETAGLYRLTYGVTHVINGGALFVGALVKGVLQFSPTTITGDTAVWGPWEEALEPIAWRVTVTRVAADTYSYKFDGRPKGQPSAPFVTVLSGTHTPAVSATGARRDGFGAGEFTLDWDARNSLPSPNPEEVGKAKYVYSRVSPTSDAEIRAEFRQVLDREKGTLSDVDYRYVRQPSGAGSMEFTHDAAAQNMMPAGRWAVHSRWTRTGAGRSDVKATRTDVPTPVNASECWNEEFQSTYLTASWAPAATSGSPADCAFPTAEYSSL